MNIGTASNLDVSRSLQVAGDLDVQWTVVFWDLFVEINVCVFDHLKCAVVRKQGTCTSKKTLTRQFQAVSLKISEELSSHLRSGS